VIDQFRMKQLKFGVTLYSHKYAFQN